YVTDFVFPPADENQYLWEPINNGILESKNFDLLHGKWLVSDMKDLDKCRNFNNVSPSGHVRLIYISYANVANPLESLKEALYNDLKIPKIGNTLEIVKRGRKRIVFGMPNAMFALFILQRYCLLYHKSGHLNYEILGAVE
ncbi:hypothetical protein KR059_011078, partial [Drosophila kikkawai]